MLNCVINTSAITHFIDLTKIPGGITEYLMKSDTAMTHLILIDCVDEKGLVYKITGVLYRHNLNIISNHEFVDRDTGHFFMRTEFAGDFDEAAVVEEIRSCLPGDAKIRLSPREKKKIVVMASREHHCLGDLLLRHEL